MKCYLCHKNVDMDSDSYSFNYQATGMKFYGVTWCSKCGRHVMEILKDNKRMNAQFDESPRSKKPQIPGESAISNQPTDQPID